MGERSPRVKMGNGVWLLEKNVTMTSLVSNIDNIDAYSIAHLARFRLTKFTQPRPQVFRRERWSSHRCIPQLVEWQRVENGKRQHRCRLGSRQSVFWQSRRGLRSHSYAGYDNKILTSARNGELIMWDLNKLGPSKFGGSSNTQYMRVV